MTKFQTMKSVLAGSLLLGLPVAGAIFSAPMWGIRMAQALRPLAWSLGWGSRRLKLDHVYAPGTQPDRDRDLPNPTARSSGALNVAGRPAAQSASFNSKPWASSWSG